jgi:response regulator RpfG family c-di-GMP phosphodiesterase
VTGRLRLLIVDDEQAVLDALARTLHGSFDLGTATSGAAGLESLAQNPDTAIVMSDMRMPGMSGATFLSKVRATAPDTVRVLLTGQADLDDAMAAINDGNIFRFLRKPCPPDVMATALAAATTQHRLVVAERELLEQTLRGSIQALTDTLALANPEVFGIATRVRRLTSRLAALLDLAPRWQLEIAAMVCELGAVNVPASVFDRRNRAGDLSDADRRMLEAVPVVSEGLIAQIPRLEGVREIVRYSRTDFNATGPLPLTGEKIPHAARVLRVAIEFEERLAAGDSRLSVLNRLRGEEERYDRAALDALANLCEMDGESTAELPIPQLRHGMIIASDIRTKRGTLLVARGHEVTAGLLSRLENFGADLASNSVLVDAPRRRHGSRRKLRGA